MNVKQILSTILIIVPFFLMAQSDSTSHHNNLSARRQRAMARREHINKLIAEQDDGALVYSKQWALGIKFNTDGWGFFYEHGKYKTINRTNLWWLELGEKKQHNQQKITPQPLQIGSGPDYVVYSSGSSFVYGKENNFYQMKLGFGRQLLIGSKGTTNGVAVSAIYGGGISLGILKPYYLQIEDTLSQTGISDIRYADNPTAFLDPVVILGASSFSKGFDKITFVPGLHARASLRFDYGKIRQTLSALEVGVNADYYAKKVTIMVNNPNRNFFIDAYVAIDFGGRK